MLHQAKCSSASLLVLDDGLREGRDREGLRRRGENSGLIRPAVTNASGECGLIAAERVACWAGETSPCFRGPIRFWRFLRCLLASRRCRHERDRAQVGKRNFYGGFRKSRRLAIDWEAILRTLIFAVVPPMSMATTVFQAVELGEKNAGVDAEYRAGFDRVDRFGLSDACDSAIDMADEKSSGVLRGLAQFVFGFK